MFNLLFSFSPELNVTLDGTTSFYKFKHNQKWLIVKLNYFKGQRRIMVEMYITERNLETLSSEAIKRAYATFDFVHTWNSNTGTPCIVVFKDATTMEEKRIDVSWV